jgi:hypothetical protein
MRRPGHDEWVNLIAEYESGGLTQKEFVEKHALPFHTFQYWLYRKSKKHSVESGPTTKFLPVQVVESTAPKARGDEAATAPIEVELPSGVRVRLASGTSARYVGELVAVLK